MSKHPTKKILKKRGASQVSSLDQNLEPSKKLKKNPIIETRSVKAQSPTLIQLPVTVLERLLVFLDVSHLEKLSSTCTFFHQQISGMYITTQNYPFSPAYLSELRKKLIIKKKPVLRLQSINPDQELFSFKKHHIFVQLALLDLSRLRELHLTKPNGAMTMASFNHTMGCMGLYWDLVGGILSRGHLANITRLDIVVFQDSNLVDIMQEMPSLLHLGLIIPHIGKVKPFIPWLESTLTACRATNLSVTVLEQYANPKKTTMVLTNCFVDRLTLRLPCNFNLHLAMTSLQEVVLEHHEPTCTFPRSVIDDRALHRLGLCGVSLASCYHNCPRLKIFAGVQIGSSGQGETFLEWSNRLKKPFHSDYVAKGGMLDLKAWSKVRGGRWFCRQVVLPKEN